jgi:hypothetical protein
MGYLPKSFYTCTSRKQEKKPVGWFFGGPVPAIVNLNIFCNGGKTLGTITKKYRLNQKVKDDNFDVDALGHYELCLEIGRDGLRICVIDTQNSRCVWLEDYRFSSIFFTEQLLDQLQHIYDDHYFLRAGFWKAVRVSMRNEPFTMVPGSLFKKEQAAEYLALVKEETDTEPEKVCYFRHQGSDMISIFSAEAKVVDWFEQMYPALNVDFVHQTSALIEGLIQNGEFPDSRALYVYVENSYLTVVVIREKSLEFCNTFFYASVQDFVYYVMFVMNELKLNPETVKVALYGAIAHDSPIFEQLYKYIRHVSFGNKPKSLRFSYTFDEVMDHQYFSAYNIYLCE